MEITKKDLRKTSKAFRSYANRVINAHYDEFDSILKMFLEHIDKTPLIYDYINSFDIVFSDEDISTEVHEVREAYGDKFFNTGNTIEEELFYTYKILKYLSQSDLHVTSYALAYGGRKYQEITKNFANRVVLPFVNHIEDYLTDIAIDMGYDEEAKFMININGGQAQVNISNDNSTLEAHQTNNIQAAELENIVTSIKALLTDEISESNKEIIIDSVDVIQEELKKENPKKGFLKTAWYGIETTIKKIPDAVQLVENLHKLGTIVGPYLT
ncbi:hypothetical protein ACQKNC_21560 [Lysinibacillus sp. NPDC094177]|uniref:hypothetical protein n=1 Tax=Lysinibacillus sp. NPDC094177 TaxID=3390580 RepID=UPI003CFEA7DC